MGQVAGVIGPLALRSSRRKGSHPLMTTKRFQLALLATLAVGAVASTTVPAVAQFAVFDDPSRYLAQMPLGDRNDHDLTWRSVHSAGPASMDPFRSPDWVTRGDPGSQDHDFKTDFSSPQDEKKGPPCHC
jgi:hypothetical protein